MRHAEVWLLRIVGVLLMLLGLAFLLAPRVAYTTRERIGHTRFTAKREKAILIPRPLAVLIMSSGVVILVFSYSARRTA